MANAAQAHSGMPEATQGMPVGGMSEMAAGSEMPAGTMVESPSARQMTGAAAGGGMPGGSTDVGPQRVLVELRVDAAKPASHALTVGANLPLPSFQLDMSYEPVPVSPHPDKAASLAASNEQTVLVRGTIDASKIAELEAQPNVVKVWKDTEIAPFGDMLVREEHKALVEPMEGFAACPIGTCDCSPTVPKGTIADVASYLGVDQIWAAGLRGEGIVVGVVDGGDTA